ncbi:hypothetical protein HOLleu_38223 [Holothuria leucospilota]|uniref:Integrase core domain-containing protein n=1 Tax=Holothuria leucospilota TaxID=206669 RepID=A0A9Q0YIF8_HOLLE|nr:hypothetical protein HOLleu_38223 [Holothuria leucospilota]
MLLKEQGVSISERHLKRILRKNGLFQRKAYSSLDAVLTFIAEQLEKSGKLHGYRWMHQRFINNGLRIPRRAVQFILKVLDPTGVERRRRRRLVRIQYRSRGPNHLWHIDGYDKIKPYGIAIHGCIDGFSRKIIWLQAADTNNNPKLVAWYFINAVEQNGGCPRRIRADKGSENVTVELMQKFFKEEWTGLIGWRQQFLVRNKSFKSTNRVVDELDAVVSTRNTHRIRGSRQSFTPGGRPNFMFRVPEMYYATDGLCAVEVDELQICREECRAKDEYPCDEDIFNIACVLLGENGLNAPRNPEALDVYLFLKDKFEELFDLM